MNGLTIIKLGGSFITYKSMPYTLNQEAITSAASQIAKCLQSGKIKSLLLVHGVGSFGHPPVLKHKLHLGFQNNTQLLAMTQTQLEVNQLRNNLMQALLDAGIPAFMTHASSMLSAEKGKIKDGFIDGIRGFLSLGMIPVIGGDMLFDHQMGFSVGSGDQVAVWLAESLQAERIVFVSDVNGVFKADPKKNPDSQVIPVIDIDNVANILVKLNDKHPADASGGMAGKLKSLSRIKPLLEKGTRIHILSMKQTGLLANLLENIESPGTELVINKTNTND